MTDIRKTYNGVVVPMVTPFNEDFSIDVNAVASIMKTFTLNEVSVFLLGTTGESTSVCEKEKIDLIQLALKLANNQVPVFAGISSNCYRETIDQANIYASLGVDAVVAHLPFYYPVAENNMVQYFESIADNIKCPLILYNNPITVNQSIPLDIVEKLSHHKNIAGFKDSERGLERLNKALELWKEREDFSFLLGWAAQSSYALLNGCNGIVPSTGNLVPELYKQLYSCAINGNKEEADKYQLITNKISEIYQKGRNITQSIPALKILMSEYGLCKPVVSPPMYLPSEDEQKKLKQEIKESLNSLAQ